MERDGIVMYRGESGLLCGGEERVVMSSYGIEGMFFRAYVFDEESVFKITYGEATSACEGCEEEVSEGIAYIEYLIVEFKSVFDDEL